MYSPPCTSWTPRTSRTSWTPWTSVKIHCFENPLQMNEISEMFFVQNIYSLNNISWTIFCQIKTVCNCVKLRTEIDFINTLMDGTFLLVPLISTTIKCCVVICESSKQTQQVTVSGIVTKEWSTSQQCILRRRSYEQQN